MVRDEALDRAGELLKARDVLGALKTGVDVSSAPVSAGATAEAPKAKP